MSLRANEIVAGSLTLRIKGGEERERSASFCLELDRCSWGRSGSEMRPIVDDQLHGVVAVGRHVH